MKISIREQLANRDFHVYDPLGYDFFIDTNFIS